MIVAIGVCACVAYLAGAARGVGAASADRVFTLADSPWAQSLLPLRDVPLGADLSPSVVVARGSMAIAKGRRSAPHDLAAVATAAAVAAFAAWLMTAGVSPFPAALGAIGLSMGAAFWSHGVWWSNDGVSPLFGVVGIWTLQLWLNTRRRAFAIVAMSAAAMALAEDPAWLAVLPGVAVWLWQRLPSNRERVRAVLSLVPVAAMAILAVIRHNSLAGSLAWVRATAETLPGSLALWRASIADPATASPTKWLMDLSGEFTPLGLALIVIGLALLWQPHHRRPAVVVTAGLLAWHAVLPRGAGQIAMPLAIGGWAAAVLGLRWLQSLPIRRADVLVGFTAALVIAEPAMARVRFTQLGTDDDALRRYRMAYDFHVDGLSPDTAVVAESRRADATLEMALRRAGRFAVLVPQHARHVERLADTHAVIAFAHARANLERVGFVFERAFIGETPVGRLAGRVPCVDLQRNTWAEISPLLIGRTLIVYGADGHAPGGVVFRAAGADGLTVRSIEPRSIPYEHGELPQDADARGLAELQRSSPHLPLGRIATIRIPETGRRDPIVLTLDRVPAAIVAINEGPSAATVCGGPRNADLTLGSDTRTLTLPLISGDIFGAGWHTIEADPDYFRWSGAPGALVRITMPRPVRFRVTITATPAAPPARQPTIDLTVNDCQLTRHPMARVQGDYTWEVDASCWRSGANRLWVGVAPLVTPASLVGGTDTRPLGARVGAIRLERLTADQNAK